MGITQALYTGVTGLSVMSDSMSVVANNIANANAKGFKYDRAEFGDLLSQSLSGGSQLGRGARLSNIRTIHTQGGLAVTERITDLAVQGSGFFVVRNPSAETQESGGNFYTRVGAFNFNKDGFLAESMGGVLLGYPSEPDGRLSTKLEPIRLSTNAIPPRATDKILMNVNLDSRVEAKPDVEFDLANPRDTSDFVNTVDIFDSHGTKHSMTTYFKRVPDDGEGIAFEWHATVDAREVMDTDEEARVHEVARGVVRFNEFGLLLSEEQEESDGVSFTKGARPNQILQFDFGKNIGSEEGNGIGVSTATAALSNTVFHQQDGYEAGNIKTLNIKMDGSLMGYYTNGVEKRLGRLALATFENVDGLQKAGYNQFYATLDSGAPRIGMPQTGTRGAVYSSTLEESNVDLAQQFVNMIMTQRGFQANSRSITTTDSMIEEVVNMKR